MLQVWGGNLRVSDPVINVAHGTGSFLSWCLVLNVLKEGQDTFSH